MADAEVIEPDAAFVRRLMEHGGDTLKKCFQCGNCSVVCNVTPDGAPFPRKEMIWAQWGLSRRLLADADVWLCHQCNDCSTHCPRGARPADVLAAVRNISFTEYAAVPALARLVASPRGMPLLTLIPIVWIGAVIAIASKAGFAAMEPIVFSNMMPVPAIDSVFLPAVGFAVVMAALGAMKLWRALNAGAPVSGPVASAAAAAALDVLTHRRFAKCQTNAPRYTAHLLTMYGFIALMATTSLVALMYWINKLGIGEVASTPLALTHPVKILGNFGALLAVTGVTLVIMRRYGAAKDAAGHSGYYDGHFIFVLFVTIASGILSELLRLAGIAPLAFGMYFVHLVFVFTLLAYAPFSKFAHLLYRFTAMTYAAAAKRDAARP
ncbi:MAG: quinone-interacting membrane-bound oxidoreductase complex subunit QmoC [Nitrospinae bacterium]|nr:quinone-interacting membrane-bound oxidoreductase complex subunit QmoC [Nitrospinota bacterium]